MAGRLIIFQLGKIKAGSNLLVWLFISFAI